MNTSRQHEPVLLWQGILAALHILFAGSAATSAYVAEFPWLGAVFAFGNLAVGAAQIGVAFYTRGQVVPLPDVVERATEAGQVVAGPANELPTNAPIRHLGEDAPLG